MQISLPKKSIEYQSTIEKIKDIIIAKGGNKLACVILFGSFARGDFVYDNYVKNGTSYNYSSDIDILIIFKNSKYNSSINLKNAIENEVERQNLNKRHSLSIIIESIKSVNKLLQEGHFFFSDIKKEGILLYQDEDQKYQLAQSKELSNLEKRVVMQKHFDIWFKNGEDFLFNAFNCLNYQKNKNAAFQLHQAVEHFLGCVLLVFTYYKPKTHKLDILIKLCANQNHQFLKIFPRDTKEEINCFNLLNSAYIDARYEEDYQISQEQLKYLMKQVKELKVTTQKTCKDKINFLKNNE
jgi:predicted nucleotidyltransferase/HEPN domain-containing protein